MTRLAARHTVAPAAPTEGFTAHVVAWVDQNGRSEGLARGLGGDVTFMPWARPRQPLPRTALGWLRSAAVTVRLVRSLPPGSALFVQVPPVFAAIAALAAARGRLAVVLDVHSGAINQRRWSWSVPLLEACMRRARATVVTNAELLDGVVTPEGRVFVLHDLLRDRRTPRSSRQSRVARRPVVVFPASGGDDEPLAAVAAAADRLGDRVEIVVTGHGGVQVAGSALTTPGFLPREEFEQLLGRADGVLALTTAPSTMQRAAYEAIERGMPLVCSDTAVLREAFDGAAVFTPAHGDAIAASVLELLARRDELRVGASAVLERMLVEQEAAFAELLAALR